MLNFPLRSSRRSVTPPLEAAKDIAAVDYAPSNEERCLASELKQVLAQKPTSHRDPPTPPAGPAPDGSSKPGITPLTNAHSLDPPDRRACAVADTSVQDIADVTTFDWIAADEEAADKTQHTRRSAALWLTTAYRQRRRARVRSTALWGLALVVSAAFIVLAAHYLFGTPFDLLAVLTARFSASL